MIRLPFVLCCSCLALVGACHGNTCDPAAGVTCVRGKVCNLQSVCVSPSYAVDADAGTVTDLVTGLVWQQETPSNVCPPAVDGGTPSALCMEPAAQAYCSTLDAGSATPGWQLPTLQQLWSLVDTAGNPTINQSVFPGTLEQPYWSADLAAGGPGNNWAVHFGGGYAVSDADGNLGAVRCAFTPDAG